MLSEDHVLILIHLYIHTLFIAKIKIVYNKAYL